MADRRLGSFAAIAAIVGALLVIWWIDRDNQRLRRVEAPAKVAPLPAVELSWITDAGERAQVAAIAAAIDRGGATDGVVFIDEGGRLPRRPAGYWRAYVVPGGPRRVVAGEHHELYYTRDDTRSFTALRGATP